MKKPTFSGRISLDAIVIGVCIFATVLATQSRLGRLPFRAVMKDELGLSPTEMARFFALAGMAWYLKPIIGVLSDHLRFLGTRRRHYLLLSGVLGAAMWGIVALVPRRYGWLLPVTITLSAVTVIGNTAVGGLLVDRGRSESATGRLSAVRVSAMNASALIAGPLGGWLAGHRLTWTAAIGASLLIMMAVCVVFLVQEVAPSAFDAPSAPGPRDIRHAIQAPGLWWVIGLAFLFYGAPGIKTALYYFQRDNLGFRDQEIGWLAMLNCIGGMLGALVYSRLCRRYRLRALLRVGVLLMVASTTLYVAYQSRTIAMFLEPVVGFMTIVAVMPLQDLTARAAPPHHEAFGYAFILSAGNLALALSDVAGAEIMTRAGLTLSELIGINAVTTLPAFLVVSQLSPELVDHSDRV